MGSCGKTYSQLSKAIAANFWESLFLKIPSQ